MHYDKRIIYWLWIGLAMVLIQVLIGGITRLTDSGLSITEWEIVEGVVPPLSESAWEEAFSLYKSEAKTQYERLHSDMTLSEFKWIYFWEWIHRFWARLMGVVFVVPLVFFAGKSLIDRPLRNHLIVVFLFAASAGIFGWIMVASGLNNDDRTWVNAYNLITHLFIAACTVSAIYWTLLYVRTPRNRIKIHRGFHRLLIALLFLLGIQFLWGGLMAGMRAGLLHPHWPFFIQADSFYAALDQNTLLSRNDWMDYEPAVSVKAAVQSGHRFMAYVVAIFSLYLAHRMYYYYYDTRIRSISVTMAFLVLLQFVLGVITVVYSIGSIPVFWGVVHQFVAFLLLLAILKAKYYIRS
jgi:cytochrome c oxidase assembly protein subunit 15